MGRHVRKHRVFRKAEPALFTDSWEQIIPLGHEVRALRSLLDALDLQYLEELYDVQGGVAYDPRRLLAVILYGIGDGVRSSRQLQEHCQFDNRYRFLMDGQTPDDRTFGRFLERLSASPETLLSRILDSAKDKVSLKTVSVDGTKMRASVSRYVSALSDFETSDPDSRRMKDRTGYFRGYNCQIAVDSDRGLIVGALVSQDAADWHQLEPTLDSVERLTGRRPERVIADRGYETASNAALCESRGIESHLHPNPQVWEEWSLDEDSNIVCPAGHPALAKDQFHGRNFKLYQRYRVAACPQCPLKSTCLKGSSRYRTMTSPVGIDPTARIRNLHRARSEEGAALLKRRSVLSETPHAQLKQNDGFRQFQRRGQGKALLDLHLWASSYNIRKLLSLLLRLFSSAFGRVTRKLQLIYEPTQLKATSTLTCTKKVFTLTHLLLGDVWTFFTTRYRTRSMRSTGAPNIA
jgi:transposase